jgi:N-methylhydantoinase A
MRFAVDVGGTFSDLVVEHEGAFHAFKAATTPNDPVVGVLDTLTLAAEFFGQTRAQLLAQGAVFVHATTRALNAILAGATARTAFLTTAGHPDILLFREGGRTDLFDYTKPFPEPYVPRALTFEVPERIWSDARIVKPLDEEAFAGVIDRLNEARPEAIAVSLLWSVVNPVHELRVGAILAERLPGAPFTLSHQLNPILREYRRASSTCIDASLKPVMTPYLRDLDARLRAAGFTGRVLGVTSRGGVVETEMLAAAPIHALNSGPSLAPLAGRRYAEVDTGSDTAIVTDSGGTSYDVSFVRRGEIPWTAESWIGSPFGGHMVGFPAVEVTCIGAGGGSIASVDAGGLLSVGPESAGAEPGPAAYGRGGSRPTVTDAALALGYLHPRHFLGGRMTLDADAARAAIDRDIGGPLRWSTEEAAAAILDLATERMVGAIEDVTINRGVDPSSAVLVGGGGSAGFNVVAIARRLGCSRIVIPTTGATLSAAGALLSNLTDEYRTLAPMLSTGFSIESVNRVIAELKQRCSAFAAGPGAGSRDTTVKFAVEARYLGQAWDIQTPLPKSPRFDAAAVANLIQTFHATHQELFAVSDPDSAIEFLTWSARIECRLMETSDTPPALRFEEQRAPARRRAYFSGHGWLDAEVHGFSSLRTLVHGPAIVESPFTTVVLPPNSAARTSDIGSLVIYPVAEA